MIFFVVQSGANWRLAPTLLIASVIPSTAQHTVEGINPLRCTTYSGGDSASDQESKGKGRQLATSVVV